MGLEDSSMVWVSMVGPSPAAEVASAALFVDAVFPTDFPEARVDTAPD